MGGDGTLYLWSSLERRRNAGRSIVFSVESPSTLHLPHLIMWRYRHYALRKRAFHESLCSQVHPSIWDAGSWGHGELN